AREAFVEAMAEKIPRGWQFSNENAWIEVWLTIRGQTAVCGVRLSDRTMRHRTYKLEHVAASLRPTAAAAMVRLAGIAPGMTVLDPMCGAGTILAEAGDLGRKRKGDPVRVLGGDIAPTAVFVAAQTLERVGPVGIARWDARRLPLPSESVDRIVCNPPFGKQLSTLEEVGPLYRAAAAEWDRVLRPGGRAGFVVVEWGVAKDVVKERGWNSSRRYPARLLGQPTLMSVWHKPGPA